ncbi:MAG: HAMP domain-containing sensor histidine kinase [Bacillota bacterium]|nr:HAMP domain-containing sensor histidine kinase [Bacillota bacterium]
MSFIKYLKDNIKLIIFYVILMMFISLAIYLDRRNRVLNSNILYIEFVSLLIFTLYIFIDFTIKSNHIKKLNNILSCKDRTPILPEPVGYKDEIYSSIIQNLYEEYTVDKRNMEHDFSENKDFMTAWAHEIKTPITTSKLLLDSSKDSLNTDFVLSLKEEIERIDDYVEKVLYYSRSDNFSKDYVITEVDIKKVINESIKKHSIIFIKKHIHLINEVSQNICVDTDKKWLLFIIDQLLSNSLKYTNTQGSITFKIIESGKEKILIIEDTGIGIKSQDINHLFSKAFTGFNGRNENIKATGFGLYLSQKLAKKLGHYITIESKYGCGTKACIHFPKWNDYYDVTKM